MNFKIFTATVCSMVFFASQAMQAESILMSDMPEVSPIGENTHPAMGTDTVSHETTVSQVTRYNNILSKTVTTVECNDTVSTPTVRWNLAFNIAALSGDKKREKSGDDARAIPPLKFEAKYPTIYLGLVDHTGDAFSLDMIRSYDAGFYLLKGGWAITKDDPNDIFGVTAAFGVGATVLALDDQDVFYIDNEGMTVCTPLEGEVYHKSRMSYYNFRLPVSFQWSGRVGRSVGFCSFGVEAEYRYHIHSYVNYKGDANHRMASHSLAVHPWAFNYLFQFGRGDWGFFLRGSFTRFFDKAKTDLGGRPVSVGASFTF